VQADLGDHMARDGSSACGSGHRRRRCRRGCDPEGDGDHQRQRAQSATSRTCCPSIHQRSPPGDPVQLLAFTEPATVPESHQETRGSRARGAAR
jgi:hypothetical protein